MLKGTRRGPTLIPVRNAQTEVTKLVLPEAEHVSCTSALSAPISTDTSPLMGTAFRPPMLILAS